ncbi:hypothetical protein CKO31_11210 [Thiohalocapsa halophila]|uniref:Uncharacterized protein n=1 Tax=Thiohalocapsa halophila TaxID=69359 RepID=A0ABS1CHB3_9GAMM|nr:hypothetical protein [Thiohalocapsa halophila]MBK1631297.1 hypothetical protein [Thiohalocapsa halophila]
MSQGKYKKALNKRVRKGHKGYPVATIAFYGPDNTRASKVVCSIIEHEDADPDPMRKWFTDGEARTSEQILGEVLAFIEEHGAKSVAMAEALLGCPHEEGIDYPQGESCPHCPYWKNRDRFSHERIH